MKKPLVIFGLGEIAQLAHYYFTNDSEYMVCGFVVDEEFKCREFFFDLPVVSTAEMVKMFNPDKYEIFIALSYSKLNQIRKEKYFAIKNLGYRLASYISSHALILNNERVGDNCFILENNVIQPFSVIGDNVTLWSGNHIGHHSTIKSHCFISSHVVISGGVNIGEQCFIGVNSTLRDHINIGEKCIIGAGSLILESADAESVFMGIHANKSKAPSSRFKNI